MSISEIEKINQTAIAQKEKRVAWLKARSEAALPTLPLSPEAEELSAEKTIPETPIIKEEKIEKPLKSTMNIAMEKTGGALKKRRTKSIPKVEELKEKIDKLNEAERAGALNLGEERGKKVFDLETQIHKLEDAKIARAEKRRDKRILAKAQENKNFWEEEGKDIWLEGKTGEELAQREAEKSEEVSETENNNLPAIREKQNEALVLANQEKENNLSGEVARARFNYVMKEYQADNILTKIKSLLKIKTETKDVDNVADAYQYYNQCLQELLHFQIGKIKNEKLSEKEVEEKKDELIKYFTADEMENLFNNHTLAKAKVMEEKFGKKPGWALEQGAKFFNWYRKQNWKKQTAFGMSLGTIVGTGGAGLTILTGYRLIGSTAAGIGVAMAAEKRYRKKEEIERGKRWAEVIVAAEKAPDMFESLMHSLENDIQQYDQKLGKERLERLKRLKIGFLAGATVFTLGTAARQLGVGHKIMEFLGISTPEHLPNVGGGKTEVAATHVFPDHATEIKGNGVPVFSDNASNFEPAPLPEADMTAGGTPMPEHLGKVVENISAQTESVVDGAQSAAEGLKNALENIRITKGTNIEKLLIGYLDEHHDLIEKYNTISGGKHFDAGQIAQRMAVDFVEQTKEKGIHLNFSDLNHVVAGQELQINTDTLQIENLTDLSYSKGFSIMKEIASNGDSNWHEHWKVIKDLTYNRVTEERSLLEKVQPLIENYKGVIGEDANFKAGESVRQWAMRMAETLTKPK